MDRREPFLKRYRTLLVCIVLAVATLAVYGRTLGHDFVNFDDERYITDQPMVSEGFTRDGVRWAFTTTEMGNWHPLTWFSHMVDVTLFGMWAGGHHGMNVALHLASALLLFGGLRALTGRVIPSALVAALFALHPLHVESVAWVSERKDTLSGLFWMATLWAYARYAKQPSLKTYLAVVLAFALGLLSKPMLVTLPFVLLLLDYWPLARLEKGKGLPRCVVRLIVEKLPLFAMTAASVMIAILAQGQSTALAGLESFSLTTRLSNACVSYASYLVKTVAPIRLAVYYPHPGHSLETWKIAGSLLLLLGISAAAWYARRSRPHFLVGWLWYLGTLVPVIGLVQVGNQAMADRYTYLPLIGIFIMLAWGGASLVERHPASARWFSTAAIAALVALSIAAYVQVGHWNNSETLFRHALAVAPESSKAHNNLGTALYARDAIDEAAYHFERAVELGPGNLEARNNWGAALLRQNRPAEAEQHFREVLRHKVDDASVHLNLAVALKDQGRSKEALEEAREALRLDPEYDLARLFIQTYSK